jgi:hypothetical protein
MDREEFAKLSGILGGVGCDLIDSTGTFNARLGKIYGVQSNADASRLSGDTEVIKNEGASDTKSYTGAHRSYFNSKDINDGKWVIFDNPATSITITAGSFWVYYTNL